MSLFVLLYVFLFFSSCVSSFLLSVGCSFPFPYFKLHRLRSALNSTSAIAMQARTQSEQEEEMGESFKRAQRGEVYGMDGLFISM